LTGFELEVGGGRRKFAQLVDGVREDDVDEDCTLEIESEEEDPKTIEAGGAEGTGSGERSNPEAEIIGAEVCVSDVSVVEKEVEDEGFEFEEE